MLEIEQDDKFQKKFWIFQVWGRIFLSLFILAAFSGVLGSGPVAFVEDSSDNIKIEYPRFTRFSHHETITVTIMDLKEDTIKLLISRKYLEDIDIARIIPQPLEEIFYKDFVQFTFLTEATDIQKIFFDVQFRSSGNQNGEWGLMGRTPMQINNLVYP